MMNERTHQQIIFNIHAELCAITRYDDEGEMSLIIENDTDSARSNVIAYALMLRGMFDLYYNAYTYSAPDRPTYRNVYCMSNDDFMTIVFDTPSDDCLHIEINNVDMTMNEIESIVIDIDDFIIAPRFIVDTTTTTPCM